jgi:UDP-N-acetylglucosamine acyltransferase
VEPGAEISDDVTIGPFAYIESGAAIGPGCRLDAHAVVHNRVVIGAENIIGHGTVIGGEPQDRKYAGEATFLEIGDRNVFREYVTVHRGSSEGSKTRVGNDNYIMAYCHLAHNVTLGDWVTIANNTGLSGHVTVESYANLGGMVGVHQYSRIGKASMVGGMSRIVRDVPPYMLVEGEDQEVHDINAVGLRRIGVTPAARLALHRACKLLFKSQLGMRNAMEIVRREITMTDEIEYLLAFEERRFGGRNGRGDQR